MISTTQYIGSHVSIATGIVQVGATTPGIGTAGPAGRSGSRGRQLVCSWHAAHSVISIAIPGVVALGIHTARIAGKSGYKASSHGQAGYWHLSVSHSSKVHGIKVAWPPLFRHQLYLAVLSYQNSTARNLLSVFLDYHCARK